MENGQTCKTLIPSEESTQKLTVGEITVVVIRKAIKNLHLGVYPPSGGVRVAAPLTVSDEAVRLAVVEKLGWIKRQQSKFAAQPRQSQRRMVDRESHYFMGQRYLLRVVSSKGAGKIILCPGSVMELHIHSSSTREQREAALQRWYREQLKAAIPPLLEKWQAKLGVEASSWKIRRMRTRWGTCNSQTGRVHLNLELAKKPPQCLEYIVVHELLHLIERKHNDHFITLLDRELPQWRTLREELNQAPLGAEEWANFELAIY